MSFVDVAEEKNMLKNELAYLKSVYGKSAGGGGGGVDDGGGDGGVETIAVGGKKGKLVRRINNCEERLIASDYNF